MQGVDMFCERCGTLQPTLALAPTRSASVLARRVLDAVGLTTADGVRAPAEDFLRLCLRCRGYSCPTCWNDDAGLCQTCVPMPEPVVLAPAPEPEPEPILVVEPEPEPEPAPAVEPEREAPAPRMPRLPVLPPPAARPSSPTELPLPPLPDIQIHPTIQFHAPPPAFIVAREYPTYAHLPPPAPPPSDTSTGLHPCRNCRLTLSARAHFCRRCGTPQES